MSKYEKDKKFYWLQLKEDFFDEDAIQWLEEQKPNGRDYAYFYLKLCLKALKSNGILVRKVGNILIAYDNKKLAEITKMDFDTVTVAMELLQRIGLVQILENGEIYITQLENLIGSVSKGALKKQQQRELKNSEKKTLGWTKGGQVSTKDKDKDKDKVKYKEYIVDIIDYLNSKTDRNFKPNTENTIKHITARLNEGYNVEDLKKVIDIKTQEWLNNPSMNIYLRPETLFGTKFESYINQKKRNVKEEVDERWQ